MCPTTPSDYVLVGGSAQSTPYVFDTSVGTGTPYTFFLKSFEAQPTSCSFYPTISVYDETVGTIDVSA